MRADAFAYQEPVMVEIPAEVTPAETQMPTPAADFFASLDSLRVASVGMEEQPLVEAVLSCVPVRKPGREWFFRIHPKYSLDSLVLELKEGGETFLLDPAIRGALLEEKCASIRTLRLGVNREGTPFIWPVRQQTGGRRDSWATTALDAVHLAETCWTRMQSDMSLGGYRLMTAKVDDVPRWPKEPFNELLRVAFKGAVVDSLDHPVLRKLRGEV